MNEVATYAQKRMRQWLWRVAAHLAFIKYCKRIKLAFNCILISKNWRLLQLFHIVNIIFKAAQYRHKKSGLLLCDIVLSNKNNNIIVKYLSDNLIHYSIQFTRWLISKYFHADSSNKCRSPGNIRSAVVIDDNIINNVLFCA